ncbi:hypothetical protein OAP88_00220 [Candidatus Pelagibacter sp.]|nr:hypothetical protein [Candidatus Pelagibacter sp.]
MNFYRNIFFIYFLLALIVPGPVTAADDAEQLLKTEEEELPLNNPFDGTTGSNAISQSASSNTGAELDNPMSLYNFKLVGVIAGKKNSYASLVSQDGRNIILQLDEELYDGFKLIDLKLNEVMFKKEDNTFVTINFKNQIKEIK